jgi:biopolymer transport protein ExbB/TolQ
MIQRASNHDAIAAAVVAALPKTGTGLTVADVETAVRNVLRNGVIP